MSKKKKFKLSKTQKRNAKEWGTLIGIIFVSMLIGIVGTKLLSNHKTPTNIVWAADSSVHVPNDLKRFLLTQDRCKNYRGKDTPTGIGLWGVFQTSNKSYAKIAYGCSWNLTNYIMAVKSGRKWQLLDPNSYFAPFDATIASGKGVLPYCSMVEKYKIPKDIESFCIKPDGSAETNTL